MNGSLFATNFYAIDRTALLPASGEVLDGTWMRKVAQQQIRAFGFAGKIAATLFAPSTGDIVYSASATVALPFNAYGSSRPPMIFAIPQYGSVAVYKQFQDENLSLVDYRKPINSSVLLKESVFRTFIDDLHYDTVTIGGVSGFRWSFTIRHRTSVNVANFAMGQYYKSPYANLTSAWFPSGDNFGIAGTGYLWLNWYALGVDTSAQL